MTELEKLRNDINSIKEELLRLERQNQDLRELLWGMLPEDPQTGQETAYYV